MAQAPGKNFLLVVGILYVVFGSLGLLTSAGGIATADYWDRVLPTANDMSWSVYYTITLIGSFFHILVGVMGLINRACLDKASILKMLGIIDIGYVILGAILSTAVFAGALGGIAAILSLVFGAVLPILYLIGAHKNHSAYTLNN